MPNSEKRFGCLGVFIVAVLCLSLLFNLAFVFGALFSMPAAGPHRVHEVVLEKADPGVSAKIAVIR